MEGVLYQHLSFEDVSDEDWLAVFRRKKEMNGKIYLHMVQPNYVEDCRLLFHKVYQSVPCNGELTYKFATLFVYERCPAAMESKPPRKVAWAIFGEQVLDHCRNLKGGMDKKVERWRACNEATPMSRLPPKDSVVQDCHDQGGLPPTSCLGQLSNERILSIRAQVTAEVEKLIRAKQNALLSLKGRMNAVRQQLLEKSQSMWKIEGTSSAAAVLQGQLRELQTKQANLKATAGASDSENLIIEAQILAISSALTALGCDASSSNIRDEVDKLEVSIKTFFSLRHSIF